MFTRTKPMQNVNLIMIVSLCGLGVVFLVLHRRYQNTASALLAVGVVALAVVVTVWRIEDYRERRAASAAAAPAAPPPAAAAPADRGYDAAAGRSRPNPLPLARGLTGAAAPAPARGGMRYGNGQ